MPEIQNPNGCSAPEPVTLISQVKRFDVIKMLERASTRLFHREEKIHAAELAQAALYLRQDGERLLSSAEHADLCKRAMGDATGIVADKVARLMGRWQPTRDTSPHFMGEIILGRLTELTDLNNKQATTIANLIAKGQRRKKSARRKSRR